MGGGGSAGGGAGAGGEDVGDVGGWDAVLADFDEGSDDDADHVPEETGAVDGDDDQWAALGDGAIEEGSDGGFAAVAGTGEGGEIVGTDEVGRGGLHGGQVEVLPAMPHQVGREGVAVGGVPEDVLVAFVGGAGDGVEGIVNGFDSADEDVGGEGMVECPADVFGWDLGLIGVEMGELAFGVDAGVGAG